MQAHHLAALLEDVVFHRGSGRKQIEVELALEAFLHDLHVQKPQKADAEAEAERVGLFGLPQQRGIVERELLEGFLQGLVLVRLDGEQARVDHGFGLAIARQRVVDAAFRERDRVADLHVDEVF